MTTFLLIRHGAHSLGGDTIAGRMAHVRLSDLGRTQALDAVQRLAHLPIRAIYSSPVTRVLESAELLGQRLGLPIEQREGLSEIDFGSWSGQRISELKTLEKWRQWNAFRSGTRVPGGEVMLETQLRMVVELERLRERHPRECVAVYSHGDVIKAAVAWALGVPLDLFLRIEIGLSSVSVVAVGDYGPWVLCVNNTGQIQLPPELTTM